MANMNEIKNNVSRAANNAIKKTGELADIASMHLKLKSLERKLEGKFTELGKLTYKQLKSGASQAEKIADTIVEIDTLREAIRLQKEKIEAEKQARKERKAAAKAGNAEENNTDEVAE